MKSTLRFLTIILVLSSCKKENVLPTQQPNSEEKSGIYSDGKMLIFSQLSDFEKVVEQPTSDVEKAFLHEVSKMKHTTYAQSCANSKSEEDMVGDEYLSQILNADLAVQIGDWIFRVNKPAEKVFALPVRYGDQYNDLINENTVNKNILEFTTEDDVFYLLGESTVNKSLTDDCASSKQDPLDTTYADNWVDTYGVYGTAGKKYTFKVKAKVRYDNWGIYRKLFTEFKHWESWGGTWNATRFTIVYTYSYTNRQGLSGAQNYYSPYNYWNSLDSQSPYIYDFNDDKKEIVHYKSTRYLTKFHLNGLFWYRDRTIHKPRWQPKTGVLHIEHN